VTKDKVKRWKPWLSRETVAMLQLIVDFIKSFYTAEAIIGNKKR